MDKPAALEELIQSLRCLPGVGPKSAQRMAYHLLQRDQKGAGRLARGLDDALGRIRHCARCNTFTEAEMCVVCSSTRRDASLLCVVESPGERGQLVLTEIPHVQDVQATLFQLVENEQDRLSREQLAREQQPPLPG